MFLVNTIAEFSYLHSTQMSCCPEKVQTVMFEGTSDPTSRKFRFGRPLYTSTLRSSLGPELDCAFQPDGMECASWRSVMLAGQARLVANARDMKIRGMSIT
ncbi:hypothetical protein N789_00555 [Arenimonas oryziterrae DSM 21050 = YC6267]|uniref:Uncharacterized protein n=1 Tax=Arenimonas oryziterrae DSM 21050 = YC6267 TaxID=1121015 RepID=A0A091BJM2_9GAMM|nr:hypothetical protein N789_00555 [Arenimonas oryziterrae DSM 21050 = YC6267]